MSENNLGEMKFNYCEQDLGLFNEKQHTEWNYITEYYGKLNDRFLGEITILPSGTHKEWITSRVNLHTTPSIMRLLYLTEAFRDTSLSFNLPASAALTKSMIEIPLHLGHLTWILSKKKNFNSIKQELDLLAFGERSSITDLTGKARVTQRVLYEHADEMMNEFFKDDQKLFEFLYKETNAVGHHNYEGRNVLVGVQNGNTWTPKDRKEWFVFISNNVFDIFLYCSAALSLSSIFCNAIDHYIKQLPDYLSEKS